LEAHQLNIAHLEDDQVVQDLILSVFHATTHTFSGTPAVKIIENHLGKAFIKMVPRMLALQQAPPPDAAPRPAQEPQ
jgi:hypothetical protein